MEKENISKPNLENSTVSKISYEDIVPLRTFQEDVKNAIGENNLSTSKIMLAEHAKRDRVATAQNAMLSKMPANSTPQKQGNVKVKKQISRKLLITVISLILFVAGGAGIYYNIEYIKPYFENAKNSIQVQNINFIDPDQSVYIDTSTKNNTDILREIRSIISSNKVGKEGELLEVVLTKNVILETESGTKDTTDRINAEDFFAITNAIPPEALARSFDGQILLGLHKTKILEPFIIIKSEDLSQTYAGMLNWEFRLGTDMESIFYRTLTEVKPVVSTPEITNIATTSSTTESESPAGTSTSTEITTSEPAATAPLIESPTFNKNKFVDLVINNKDTRAVINSEGKILFFYSLIDNENVIMATNRETLGKVLERINNSKLIR